MDQRIALAEMLMYIDCIFYIICIYIDSIKEFLFYYVDTEITEVKENAKIEKNKLTKPNLRMCVWIFFQRCKMILDDCMLLHAVLHADYMSITCVLHACNARVIKF